MLTVLAVICPPLAVLATGRPGKAVVNVGLTALLYVPGVIHALNVVGRHNTEKWGASLLRAVERYESAAAA